MTAKRAMFFGLLLCALALGIALMPQSETYSDDGFGYAGRVDVECGSILSPDVNVDFDDQFEQDYYDSQSTFGGLAIFEGQTATQVCDDVMSDARTLPIVLVLAGVALFIGGLVTNKKQAAASLSAGDDGQAVGVDGAPPPSPPAPPTFDPIFADSSPAPDAATAKTAAVLERVRGVIGPYVAPPAFALGTLAYVVAMTKEPASFDRWGVVTLVQLIAVVAAAAGAVSWFGKQPRAEIVAAIGASLLLGDGAWRIPLGVSSLWIRVLLVAADLAIAYGLVQFVVQRGRPPTREGAPLAYTKIVLAAVGAALFCVAMLGRQLWVWHGTTQFTYIVVAGILPMLIFGAALLIRSPTGLLFAGGAFALRCVTTVLGNSDGIDGPWQPLTAVALAGVTAFAIHQWLPLRDATFAPPMGDATPPPATATAPAPAPASLLQSPTPPPSGAPPDPASPAPPVVAATPVLPVPAPVGSAEDTIARPRGEFSAILADGTMIRLDRPVVFGREPAVPDHLVGAVTQPVSDTSRMVSRTHAAMGVDDGNPWVEDLHSANGVEFVDPSGQVRAITPGVRTPVPAGMTVRLGDVDIQVLG